MLLFSSYFFKINICHLTLFQEHYQRVKVWIQFKVDTLSVLLWVQTVCKGYQQTMKVATIMKIVKSSCYPHFPVLKVGSVNIRSHIKPGISNIILGECSLDMTSRKNNHA